MRFLISVVIIVHSLSCVGQYRRSFNFIPVFNMNVVINGVGNNDVGAGLGLNATLFGKQKLHLLCEASTDRFLGDKSLYIDSLTGKHAKNAIIYNLKIGAQYFPTRRLGLTITYGPSWYLLQEFSYTRKPGFKYGANVAVGKDMRVQVGLSVNHIRKEYTDIAYMSLVTGVRL